jgi:DNA-binding NtrC family response regulator
MSSVVSVVRNWLRSLVGGDTLPSPVPRQDHNQPSVLRPILLASERDDDHRTLEALLHDTGWTVAWAKSWGDASNFCGRVIKPVILVDRHFQGSDWRFTVSSMVNFKANSCLILLSDVSDQYLWNEVVQHGGFDVLARPFERSALLRVLAFAEKHREGRWPALHPSPKGDSLA